MTQKKRTKMNSVKKPNRLLIAVAGIVLVLLLILLLGGKKENGADPQEIQKSLAFLEREAQKDPNAVRQYRQDLQNRRLEAQKDELLAKLESGEIDPFTILQDVVILGDSRVMGYSLFGFLPEEQVLSGNGHKIFHIPDWYDTLKAKQPQYVFLCYGVNDCAIQYWSSPEEHSAEYMEYIRELKQMLPNSTIVVSSILPVEDFTFADYPTWEDLPEWNATIKATCKEEGVLFADCDYLYDEYSSYWIEDGFHFDAEVYPHWISRLIITALYGDLLEET